MIQHIFSQRRAQDPMGLNKNLNVSTGSIGALLGMRAI